MRNISADRVVWTSFFVDVLDVVLNLIVAVVTSSVVMLAEALQGGADLVTAGLLVVGLKRSKRRADALHRFGYGREVYFWALLAGALMMLVTATLSIYYGYERIVFPKPIENIWLAYAILVFALISNAYAFRLSYLRLMGLTARQSIWQVFLHSSRIETKVTLVLDLMGSLSALFGLVSLATYGFTGNSQFDGVGAVVIGLGIAFLSLLLVISIQDFLVGRGASPEVIEKIREATVAIPEVDRILDLRTMYIGTDKLLVNMEVHIGPSLKTASLERLIDEIKTKVKQAVPSVDHIQVELETP